MSFRPERIGHAVRDVVSDAIATRISDPRVSRFASVTRVEMSGDLRLADVYISVMGSDADAGKTMRGLESAKGLIHGLLARALDIRQCPTVRFHLDRGLKIAAETIRQIDEALADAPTRAPDDSEASSRKDPSANRDTHDGADE